MQDNSFGLGGLSPHLPVDPRNAFFDPLLQPLNFILVGITYVVIAGNLLAENGPALEVAGLGFAKLGSGLVDESIDLRRGENGLAQFGPSGAAAFHEFGIVF